MGKGGKAEVQVLLQRKQIARDLYLTRNGKVLVVPAGRNLIFGAVHLITKPNGEAKNVTWREISLPEEVSSIDIRA